jgi:hypothetical protein
VIFFEVVLSSRDLRPKVAHELCLKVGCKRVASPPDTRAARLPFYLTKCINSMVLEIQLPHKIVHLLFTITYQNNELTIGGEIDFPHPFN